MESEGSAFTRARHMSPILNHKIPRHTLIPFRQVFLPSTLRSLKQSLPLRVCNYSFLCISHLFHSCYIYRPLHPPWFDQLHDIWWRVQFRSYSLFTFLRSRLIPSRLGPNILLSTLCSLCSFFRTHTKQFDKMTSFCKSIFTLESRQKKTVICGIWSSHSSSYLLGYKAVLPVEIQPTFRRSMPLPSSGLKETLLSVCFMLVSCLAYSSTLKMEATSVNFKRTTQLCIPQGRTTQKGSQIRVQGSISRT
jgi:hypothetical protein